MSIPASPPRDPPSRPPGLVRLDSAQRHVVAASFLGWTLDAFDFFLLVFVLKDIAAEFDTDITASPSR